MARLHLVACVARKKKGPLPARELYDSPWFRKARAHVEWQGDPWFILSAKHGLLHPEERIVSYEQTLTGAGVLERKAWALGVLERLMPLVYPGSEVVLLAGRHYYEHLVPVLEACGVQVQLPLRGLRIGEQLAWFDGNQGRGRLADLGRFCAILDDLSERIGGPRQLHDGRGPIPAETKGLYFFFEPGESRSDSGSGPRVVRVGTHAVSTGSRSTLWKRLSQHRGTVKRGGGNHRSSVFRLLLGAALARRDGIACPTWGSGSSAAAEVRRAELELEREVSATIRRFPYLWLAVEDEPGPGSARAVLERNAIALLSDLGKPPLDAPSSGWLGRHSHKEKVRESGLWNSDHVDKDHDPSFLDLLESYVKAMPPGRGRASRSR